MARFPDAVNEQIAHEFAASQQYVAIAVHYEAEALPQLAGASRFPLARFARTNSACAGSTSAS